MAQPSTRVRLRVSPGARRSDLVGRHGDGSKVRGGARERIVLIEGIDRAESERRVEGAL